MWKRAYKNRTTYPTNWSELRATVLKRDGYACRRCGITKVEAAKVGRVLHIDHIKRLADGGTNKLSNLQCLCNVCHSKRPGHSHMRR